MNSAEDNALAMAILEAQEKAEMDAYLESLRTGAESGDAMIQIFGPTAGSALE